MCLISKDPMVIQVVKEPLGGSILVQQKGCSWAPSINSQVFGSMVDFLKSVFFAHQVQPQVPGKRCSALLLLVPLAKSGPYLPGA